MYEVEVKVPTDLAAVRERLEALEATALGTVRQTDTYYDAPDRDFAATDEALRLRREVRLDDTRSEEGVDAGPDADARTTFVTYKGPLVDADSKTRAEVETSVADGEAMATVLERLGYEPAATVEKERERYVQAEFTVSLDEVTDLGEFVEVERSVREAGRAVDDAREGAFAVLRELGVDPEDQIRSSYLGLLLGQPGGGE